MENKIILIFGGTGSLGYKLNERYRKNNIIYNFSRDECKHWEMKLAFNNDKNIHFIPARTVVNIMNPGGKATKHSFTKFVEKWYATKVDQTLKSSGLFQNIENAVGNSLENLGAGKNASKEAIRLVTEKYAQGVVEL